MKNYREEDRITTNNARRIEFLTTIYKFDKLLKGNLKILDCAAGTGAYAFYLADKGHNLTATDITPRHIKIINEQLKDRTYSMETKVLDATDMRCFEDGCFDVVLNMGPFYHLTDDMSRNKCLSESIRVLKKVDILLQHIFQDYILIRCLLCQLLHDNPKCFWTDTYYSSYDEMQKLYKDNGIECIDQFAQDGLAPLFHNRVDQWNNEQFEIWLKYHLSVCSEKSIIDMSNHVIIIGRKN
jgi:Methylase involved in ubiquinone/menaquinone biosynthesis